ncbi:hypothetical protein GCM10020219_048530 [Nonomuraea dietziae]
MAVTKVVSLPKKSLISLKTLGGLIGTSSKSSLRGMLSLSVATLRDHFSLALGGALSSCAASAMAFRNGLACETMPRSGSKTLPSWVGSMSTWMNVLPLR